MLFFSYPSSSSPFISSFFFFNAPAPTEIYTLSLHDALPICMRADPADTVAQAPTSTTPREEYVSRACRSEEHTSELQSRGHLVCRLLLEKKNKQIKLKYDDRTK